MKITPALYQKLIKLNDRKIAIDQFMKQMMSEGQRIVAEMNVEQREIWMAIQKETLIDLQMTDWAPSQDTPNEIVLIQQRFFPGQTPKV